MEGSISRRDVLQSVGGAGVGALVGVQTAVAQERTPLERHIVGVEPGQADVARQAADEVYRVLDFGSIGQAVSGWYSENALDGLRNNPNVRYIEAEGVMEAIDQTLPWGIDRVDADVAHDNGETGAGADIAIIDTGIDDDHPDLQANVGAGAPARGPSVTIQEGRAIEQRDVHYANGTYDGPMTHEVVIDRQTANRFDVSVGDTLYVGGTIQTAREHEFTVVGISPTYSRFLGTPTVTMHLSELQEVTGTTAADRATFITVDVADGEDPEAVKAAIEAEYPEYEVRTNQEQIRAILGDQAVVIASAASLVVLAVVGGLALATNVMVAVIYRQRRELSVLRALGWSPRTVVGTTTIWALLIGLLGSALGVAVALPAAHVLNEVVAAVVGFEGLVRTPPRVVAGGAALGVVVSAVAALAISALVTRAATPGETLR